MGYFYKERVRDRNTHTHTHHTQWKRMCDRESERKREMKKGVWEKIGDRKYKTDYQIINDLKKLLLTI